MSQTTWFASGVWNGPAIRETLARCHQAWFHHERGLASPVEPAVVTEFEERQGVQLPEDYRTFVVTVGSGGAGPGYGLVLFDRSDLDEGFAMYPLAEFDSPTEFYRTPFDHEEPWQIDFDAAARGSTDLGDTGTWFLADFGCASADLLILAGRQAGSVWHCDTGDFSKTSTSFAIWYSDWLDQLVATQARPTDIRIGHARTVTTEAWIAMLLSNELRRADDRTFQQIAFDYRSPFDQERYDQLTAAQQDALVDVVRRVAIDQRQTPVPPGSSLTPSTAADLIDEIGDRLAQH